MEIKLNRQSTLCCVEATLLPEATSGTYTKPIMHCCPQLPVITPKGPES